MLLPFAKEGYAAGDRLFQVVCKSNVGKRREKLQQAGIEVGAAEEKGQLEIRPWEEAYLRNGRFDQDAMLELIQEVLQKRPLQGPLDDEALGQHGMGA